MSQPLPFPRILLGPGPSSISPKVLEALGRAPIGQLDPEIFTLLDSIRTNLRILFGTQNSFTIPLTGTGMAGMECVLANLIEPEDNVVIGINGFFGTRMAEIARRLGAKVHEVHAVWGKVLEPELLEPILKSLPSVKLVACVHAETSTGVLTPIRPIADLAHKYGALFVADTVTSLGGLPVELDENGVDASYSATQKCVGASPGLAPVTVSEKALNVRAARKTPVSSWYYDWKLLQDYYDGAHVYHHTVPSNLYYALDEALKEALEEGLETRYTRHREVSERLLAGLAELGILPFAQEGYRLPMLNAVRVPESVADETQIRKHLLTQYGLEIGGGLGALKGKVWRIGTMGFSATHRNVILLLSALREVVDTSR